MKTLFVSSRFGGRAHAFALTLSVLLPFLAAGAAYAQGPGGRNGGGGGFGRDPLSDEQLQAAWSFQVLGVAEALTLDEEKAGKLDTAYVAARKETREALREIAQNRDGDRRARFEKINALTTEKSDAFKKSLTSFLTEEEAAKAGEALGGFGANWDQLCHVLMGLELAPDKQAEAAALIAAHVKAADKARAEAASDGDFQARAQAARELKEGLDEKMAGILSEEQLATWKEKTGFGGGRGGPGGPGGGGRRGAGGSGGTDGGSTQPGSSSGTGDSSSSSSSGDSSSSSESGESKPM